ncbi:MAG: hypothetical protein HC924_04440 [Synechococcaceae cyanobacterium SM2_3_2]|nr:hypothetical protein [Synechococcaceae cyanobacterium SM2_3_2]
MLIQFFVLVFPVLVLAASLVYPQLRSAGPVMVSAYFWILMLAIVAFLTQNQWFSWLMLLPDPWARAAMFLYGWYCYLVLPVVIGTTIGWGVVNVLPDSIPGVFKTLISAGSALILGAISFPLWRLDPFSSSVYAQAAARQQNLQEVLDIQLEIMSRYGMEREAQALQRRGAQPGWWPDPPSQQSDNSDVEIVETSDPATLD